MGRSLRTAPLLACLVFGTGLPTSALAVPPEQHPALVVPTPKSLSLDDLEQLALQRNPTLAQAALQVEASRGKAVQAGLYPNPTIGYEADLIGTQHTRGEIQ